MNDEKAGNFFIERIQDLPQNNLRVDIYLCEYKKIMPRSQLKQRLLALTINDKPAKLSKRLKIGDLVEANFSQPPELKLEAENIKLSILYEDEEVIVINKPAGMIVHPGAGQFKGTLVNALLYYFKDLKQAFPNENLRPGLVHRLDKDTSGVMIVAKNIPALDYLANQFRRRKVKKLYLAIVKGLLPAEMGRIESLLVRDRHHRQRFISLALSENRPKKAKLAITEYRVLRQEKEKSLLALRPLTGRTHQLRAQLKALGNPILGDKLYGASHLSQYLLLHSWKLKIKLPTLKKIKSFKAPLPKYFKKMLPQQKSEHEGTLH